MAPAKRLSKSQLSMYLRTTCDRELYLSLHQESELARHHLPVPLKARLACTRFRRHRVRCFMEREVSHGETKVYAGVQA
jgi:hypothetical protein